MEKQKKKTIKIEPEPLVDLHEVMKIYGNKKTYWNKAKDVQGLPFYDLGRIKYRLSEVEEWVQQRKRINT